MNLYQESTMVESNTLEYIIGKVRNKAILTKDYMVCIGKRFLQAEYEDMGIKFVDKKVPRKYK